MKKIKKNKKKLLIIGIGFLFITICGYILKNNAYLQKSNNQDKELAQQYEKLFQYANEGKDINVYAPEEDIPLPDEIDGKTYDAAQPSTGPLLTTIPVKILLEGNKASLNSSSDLIKNGQKIIFYTPDDELLGTGTITKTSQTEIEYQFDDKYVASLDKEEFNNNADILVSETSPTKRIPHSSVVKGNEGYFVYLAKANLDNNGKEIIEPNGKVIVSKIVKQIVNTAHRDDWFIEAGYNIDPTDLIILNPDDNIKEGDKIKIKIVEINSSENGPVVQSWLNKEARETTKLSEEMNKLASSCGLAATLNNKKPANCNSNGDSSSCGDSIGQSKVLTKEDAYRLLGITPIQPTETLQSLPKQIQ